MGTQKWSFLGSQRSILISYMISKTHRTTSLFLYSHHLSNWKTRVLHFNCSFIFTEFSKTYTQGPKFNQKHNFHYFLYDLIKLRVHIFYRQLCSGNNAVGEIIFKCQPFTGIVMLLFLVLCQDWFQNIFSRKIFVSQYNHKQKLKNLFPFSMDI